MNIKVVLVDDHKLVREGFRKLLESESTIEVVGEADNGRTAVELTRKLHPAVVLMDISLPDINGIDAIRQIKEIVPEAQILVLSMYSTKRFVTEALGAGAGGYLLKDAAARELIEAVRAVADGKVYLSPAIAGVIVQDYQRRSSSPQPGADGQISPREHQVIRLVAEGKNTKEIAFLLDLSVKTVESHRAQLMKKLNLRSVADMVKYAIREGLTPLE
jgi:DNA-binding NarL/FixJ family response regulator